MTENSPYSNSHNEKEYFTVIMTENYPYSKGNSLQ